MKNEKIEPWLLEATEVMARTGCSLTEAAGLLDQTVDSDLCEAIVRRKSFLKLLWEARHRYFSTLGKDPNFTQDVLIGRLLGQAQKLEDEGANDKAAEVLLKIAKIRGWVGPENQISVFGELSQSDLDAIRRKVEEGTRGTRPN